MLMTRRAALILLAACLFLLSACSYVETVGSADPASGQGTAGAESAPPPTESGKPDAVPWELPEEGDAIPYEEYFSQTRIYGLGDRRWGLPINGRWLHQEGSRLYVMDSRTRELLWKIVELDDMEVVFANARWVYLIVGGTELIRMDYLGENRETLFTDETGLISRMNQGNYDEPGKVYYDFTVDGPRHPCANNRDLPVADWRVLYFWAGAAAYGDLFQPAAGGRGWAARLVGRGIESCSRHPWRGMKTRA